VAKEPKDFFSERRSSASAEAVPQPPRKFQTGIPKLPRKVIRPQQPRLTHATRNTENERTATRVALGMVALALDKAELANRVYGRQNVFFRSCSRQTLLKEHVKA
jgi:hypothetical protein